VAVRGNRTQYVWESDSASSLNVVVLTCMSVGHESSLYKTFGGCDLIRIEIVPVSINW
jgi:hypothetical protein